MVLATKGNKKLEPDLGSVFGLDYGLPDQLRNQFSTPTSSYVLIYMPRGDGLWLLEI
jgi:hypothetical protein